MTRIRHRKMLQQRAGEALVSPVFTEKRDFSAAALLGAIQRAERDLERLSQHGPVKTYTPEEIAAINAEREARGL